MSPRLYLPEQEEHIFIRKQAALWKRSGLISREQWQSIHTLTESDLRQTNWFFRCLFFLFALVLIVALVGLFCWLLDGWGSKVQSGLIFFSGLVCLSVAEYLIKRCRLYRHGLEEAFFLAGVFLPGLSIFIFGYDLPLDHQARMIFVCLLVAVFSGWVYWRAGYLYALLLGIAALCALPFSLNLTITVERMILVGILSLILLGTFIAVRPAYDFQKKTKEILQACLWGAIYLTVNLHIGGILDTLAGGSGIGHFRLRAFPAWMYWTSYLFTFVLSAAGIFWGIKSRKRLILNLSLIMACATLAVNKSYLGWTRYTWDPVILGVFLIVLALLISRWLKTGPEGRRFGFTVADILKPEYSGIDLADVAAALTPGVLEAPSNRPDGGKFSEGGASGGGGAERSF